MNLLCKNHVQEHIHAVSKTFDNHTEEILTSASAAIRAALADGKKVLLFGNGGSAADAQHIAAEFLSKLSVDRIALPGIALTVDTSALTAISNDYGYDFVFSRQLNALGNEGDIAIGISTSGNSVNVLNGLKEARRLKMTTISFSGARGLASFDADFQLKAQSQLTAVIQEIHIMFGHILCGLSELDYV